MGARGERGGPMSAVGLEEQYYRMGKKMTGLAHPFGEHEAGPFKVTGQGPFKSLGRMAGRGFASWGGLKWFHQGAVEEGMTPQEREEKVKQDKAADKKLAQRAMKDPNFLKAMGMTDDQIAAAKKHGLAHRLAADPDGTMSKLQEAVKESGKKMGVARGKFRSASFLNKALRMSAGTRAIGMPGAPLHEVGAKSLSEKMQQGLTEGVDHRTGKRTLHRSPLGSNTAMQMMDHMNQMQRMGGVDTTDVDGRGPQAHRNRTHKLLHSSLK